jgi:membrane protease YdiL (CAAX protease family)
VALWFPETLKLLHGPGWRAGLGLTAVAAALAYQAAGHHADPLELVCQAVTSGPVGFVEELLFRGFIWERCRQASAGPALVWASAPSRSLSGT